MKPVKVVSREEWNEAREALLVKETNGTHERDLLNAERRALPRVRFEKEYTFTGPDGPVTLFDLFDGGKQLIVYHFMFHPDWEEGCPHCTGFVEEIDDLSPLHAAETRLVVVSRAPLEKLERYKRHKGWTIPWYSSFGTEFNHDFEATLGDEEVPAQSFFLREGDNVYLTYSASARGGEIAAKASDLLALTPLGHQN